MSTVQNTPTPGDRRRGPVPRSTLRRWLRRHWLTGSVNLILIALVVNAWVQAGGEALLVLALAAMGCSLVIIVPAYVAGGRTTRHAHAPAREVDAAAARQAVARAERDAAEVDPRPREATR